jgi:hypothetical protein
MPVAEIVQTSLVQSADLHFFRKSVRDKEETPPSIRLPRARRQFDPNLSTINYSEELSACLSHTWLNLPPSLKVIENPRFHHQVLSAFPNRVTDTHFPPQNGQSGLWSK